MGDGERREQFPIFCQSLTEFTHNFYNAKPTIYDRKFVSLLRNGEQIRKKIQDYDQISFPEKKSFENICMTSYF